MRGFVIVGILLLGTVGNTYGDLTDNFESYPLDAWPGPNWVPDASAASDPLSGITLDLIDSSNQVLRMHASTTGYWAALTYNSYSFPMDYIIEARVFNGSEYILGSGHDTRATIGMRHGTSWTNPGRNLLMFHGNGTVYAGDLAIPLGTYETERWYDVKIHYQREGANLSLQYWLDGADLGKIALTIAPGSMISSQSIEDSLDHFELTTQAGTGYFDDINVSPIPIPGAALLAMIGMSAAGVRLRKHA